MNKLLHVLLVEDSESDASRIFRLIEQAGYELDACRCETAAQMRVAIEKHAWDVIISDYNLPQFNAPASLALLKQSGKDIPFIVVSGTMGEDTVVAMMKLGVHDYMMKDNLLRLVPAIEREIREAKIRHERQRVEAALAEERDLLRTILEHTPDRMYFKDLHSRFTRISKSQAIQFGLSSPIEACGKTDFDFFTEEHARLAYEAEQQIIATGQSVVNLEEKETWPDGHITWVSTTKIPLTDVDSQIIGTFGISRNITQRKIAEQTLLEEKERYRSLYENIPVGLYRTTPDGQILMANPAIVKMLGYESFEELAKTNLEAEDYGQGYPRNEFKKRVEQKGLVRGLEANLRKKDGSLIFIRESGQAVQDVSGKILYYEGTIEDITEIRQSEMQNLRLVAAIENAAEVVILSDLEGNIQYINTAIKKILGIEPGDLVGKNMETFSHSSQNMIAWKFILEFPRSGQIWHGDILTNHENGSMRELDATISPIVGLNSEISSLVYVMRDVTQERKLETERRRSLKLEAIGQLSAGVASEINTPTQFIGNNLHFLKTAFQDLSNYMQQYLLIGSEMEQNKISAETINKLKAMGNKIDLDLLTADIPAAIEGSLSGIDRVARIVGALKEFSHPGTQEKTMTNINHAIDNTITVSRNEWKYAAQMYTVFDPGLPQIPCLVDEFNQVILNLINNAVDAIREADVKGQMTENGKISIQTQHDGDWVIVKVSDNGPGIPVEIQDRVFDPFFSTKAVGKGTGQGLSISYDVIVNKHGGKIAFETQAGKGTTFIIHLPIQVI